MLCMIDPCSCVWWRAFGDVTASCHFFASYSGFSFSSASSSRSPPSFTRRCLRMLPAT